ncbi:hypothetical protein HFP72_12185 [Nocardiopsis sp. ARC36]
MTQPPLPAPTLSDLRALRESETPSLFGLPRRSNGCATPSATSPRTPCAPGSWPTTRLRTTTSTGKRSAPDTKSAFCA